MAKQVIKRKVAMAALRADDATGMPSIHTIKYRRVDGSIGYKRRVSKSFQHIPGAGKFRGNMNSNHEFLFKNHEEPDDSDNRATDRQHFRIKVDLLVEVDGHIIDHTNGEYAATRQ